jgi:hypothetical protein
MKSQTRRMGLVRASSSTVGRHTGFRSRLGGTRGSSQAAEAWGTPLGQQRPNGLRSWCLDRLGVEEDAVEDWLTDPTPSKPSPRAGSAAMRPHGPVSARARRRGRSWPACIRLLRAAAVVVCFTWLPGVVGSALGLGALTWWGTRSGYLGLSWLVPGALVGLAAARAARSHGLPGSEAAGWLTGACAAALFLVGAAQIVGG